MNPYFRFAIIYLGLTLLLGVLFWALEVFAGLSAGSGTSAILPMFSGMMEGQYAARSYGAALPKKRMWRDSFVFTLVAAFTSFWVVVALVVAGDQQAEVLELIESLEAGIWGTIIALVFIFSFLMIRLGYGMGIRNELKAKARRRR